MRIRPSAHIWMAADQFVRAGDLLLSSEDVSCLVYPLLVNYALGVELALKSTVGKVAVPDIPAGELIPAASIKSVRGHLLYNEVFCELPGFVRRYLIDNFQPGASDGLVKLLTMCDDYFVRARYAHEFKGGAFDLGAVHYLAHGVLLATKKYGEECQGI